MTGNQLSVSRRIHADAADIFTLLQTPSRHHEFDGSGSVQLALGGGGVVGLGDVFGMNMKAGASYSTRNEVVEFEQDRLIAWRTLAPKRISAIAGGRTWRYQLLPLESGVLVRETWDIGTEAFASRFAIRALASHTAKNMARTLECIEALLGTE